MTIRLYVGELLLAEGHEIDLPAGAARHAQVRRVQPGVVITVFGGQGQDWPATVLDVGRQRVKVRLGAPLSIDRELPFAVTLAIGMPANERMDLLVEKATELGVTCIQPLHTDRSVLRLAGDRAGRKRGHWQAIAEAACEQCGRAKVPFVAPVRAFSEWLPEASAGLRLVLSLQADARPMAVQAAEVAGPWPATTTLNGPEGGLTPDEEALARAQGFVPTTLGPRVLRADTAPLALLAWLALRDKNAN